MRSGVDAALQSPTRISGLAFDASGNVDVAGYARGANLGGARVDGLFHLQLDPSGVVRWARQDHGPAPGPVSAGSTLATTATGDVVMATTHDGAGVDLGCGVLSTGASNTYAAAFDGDTGACKFTVSLGETRHVQVAVDPGDDAIVVAGDLRSSLDAGSGTLTPRGGGFVVRLDATGVPIWGRVFASASNDAYDVAVDPVTHDIAVTGFTEGPIDFGTGLAAGVGDVFVARFSSGGDVLAAERLGDGQAASGNAIRFSPDGASLAIGGNFQGALAFGEGVVVRSGGDVQSAFLAAFTP